MNDISHKPNLKRSRHMGTKQPKKRKSSVWLAGIIALTIMVAAGIASNVGRQKMEANQIRSPWDTSSAPPQYAGKHMVRILQTKKPVVAKKPLKSAKAPVTVATAATQR